MAWRDLDIGAVSAYAIAVEHGYTGTEEEWASEQAAAGENARIAKESAKTAVAAAKAAQSNLDSIKPNTEQAITDIQNEGSTQRSSVTSTGDAQNQRVMDTGAEQSRALSAQGDTEQRKVIAAGDEQVSRVTTAGNNAVESVTLEKTNAINDVQNTKTDAVNSVESAKTIAVEAVKSAESVAIQNIGTGIDDTLSISGKAADAKKTGDSISSLKDDLDKLNEGGLVIKDEVIAKDINNWLDEHPEATTTVQDGSLDLNKFKKNAIPFITLSQLGATIGGDVSDILLDAINNYTNRIIVIDNVYRCYKDITVSVSNWHIYALPDTKIITDHTLTISNCSNIKIDNLVWRDETNSSEQIGLVLESTVSSAIFNRCTIRGFKTACVLNDLAYVVFNDCNFITGSNSETLVRINNYFSELSKFNRCNFEGGFTETTNCTTGIEIQAGVWFEFNSCDITNCETLLKINDIAANTRQLRFTNCTFNNYIYGIVWGDRGITSLLFSQCIFSGNGGKYNDPLYLLKDVRGNVTFKDCFETTKADNYCFVKVAENVYATIMGNFLEAIKFYDATTENVKNNSFATMNIELTNPNTVSMARKSTGNYTQINSIGFFIPKLLWSDNKNAYKVIPYCEKPGDTTCRIFFGVTTDGNAYTYVYQLCRLW